MEVNDLTVQRFFPFEIDNSITISRRPWRGVSANHRTSIVRETIPGRIAFVKGHLGCF